MNTSKKFSMNKWREFIVEEQKPYGQDIELLDDLKKAGKIDDEGYQKYYKSFMPYASSSEKNALRLKLELILNPLNPTKPLSSFPQLQPSEGKFKLEKLSDLSFDMLKAVFPDEYQTPKYHSFSNQGDGWAFQDSATGKLSDGGRILSSTSQLESYKEGIIKRYGDVPVILDPESITQVQPISKELSKSAAIYGAGVQAYYDSKKPGEYTGD